MPQPVDTAAITPSFSRPETTKSVTPPFATVTPFQGATPPPFTSTTAANAPSIPRLRQLIERIRRHAEPHKNRKLNSLLVELSVEIEKLK